MTADLRPWRGDPELILTAEHTDIHILLDRLRRARPKWHDEAACAGAPTGLFFPDRGASTKQALDLCEQCPVRSECLAEAVADPTLDHGVRGGLSVPQRKALRRNQHDEVNR